MSTHLSEGSDPSGDAPSGPEPTGEGATEWFGTSIGRQFTEGAVPKDRPDALAWLFFAILGFLVGQVAAAAFALIGSTLAGNHVALSQISVESEPPTWFIASSLLGLWTGFAGSAWLASRVKGTKHVLADIGLRFRWIDLVGVPIGVGSQYVVALLYFPISQHVHDFSQKFDSPSQRLTGSAHGSNFTLVAVLTVCGAPLFEEIFFRGVLLRGLARAIGRPEKGVSFVASALGGFAVAALVAWRSDGVSGWQVPVVAGVLGGGLLLVAAIVLDRRGSSVGPTLAVLVTGLLFGLAHAEALQLLGLAFFGVVLSVLAYRTGRLGMGILAHASFNAVALASAVVGWGLLR